MDTLVEIVKWIGSSAVGAAVIWYFTNRSLESFKATLQAEIEGWTSRAADLWPRQRDLAVKAYLRLVVADHSVRTFIKPGRELSEEQGIEELSKTTGTIAELAHSAMEAHIVMPKGVGDRLDQIVDRMMEAAWPVYESVAVLHHSAGQRRLVAQETFDRYGSDMEGVITAVRTDLRGAVGSDTPHRPSVPGNVGVKMKDDG